MSAGLPPRPALTVETGGAPVIREQLEGTLQKVKVPKKAKGKRAPAEGAMRGNLEPRTPLPPKRASAAVRERREEALKPLGEFANIH